MSTKTTSSKAGKADPKDVERINKWAEAQVAAGKTFNDELDMRKILAEVATTYSRTWQIAMTRVAELTANDRFVPDTVKADPAEYSKTVITMRDKHNLSWGRIGVVARQPEGQPRKAYRTASGHLDRGTRIGKGGRWLRDDVTVYDHADRFGAGAVVSGQVLLEGGIKVVTEAARAEDWKTFNTYVLNSKEAPAKVTPAKRTSKKAAKAA
jgi:hypothetical protein